MQTDFSMAHSNVAFGRIRAVSGGADFLKNNLSIAEKMDFAKLVEAQKSNPVDVVISQHSDKRISGWTVFSDKNTGIMHRKDYTQGLLFDSPMKFIEKLCKKADDLKVKYFANIPDGINDIFEKLQ